ncbi:MAG: carbohydrate ABC transporter permease [Treponema sp.]|jgi:putative aldouronate transport system permease protein|nr:carbohydrate ABC transporter permease [Treponema sp.]
MKFFNTTIKDRTLSRFESRAFAVVNSLVMVLIIVCTLYPFWNTIVVSLNQATDTLRGGLTFWPRKFSLQNYKIVFATGTIYNAFFISVSRTIINTVVNVFFTSMVAFALSRREFVLRKPFTMILILSMYVNAGLIPNYFLMRSLHLTNSFLVYVVPGIINAFNFVVIRTYMRTMPESIIESARIDGCGDFWIFTRIILPLCLPVLATIALFVAVESWNAWFDTLIYNSGEPLLHTLQYKLMEYIQSSQSQAKSSGDVASMSMQSTQGMVTPVSIRAAVTVIAALPIMIVYPFMQRYFVVGLNVGSVKE